MNNDPDQNFPDFDPPLYSQVNQNTLGVYEPETTDNHFLQKSENIIVFIIILSSILGSFGIFYYSYTFEEPKLFYIECSVTIDEDKKNYNKSNPLNSCQETVTQSKNEGILQKKFPIRVVQDISRITMIGSLISFSLIGFCNDMKKSSLKTIIYSVVVLVFVATVLSYLYSVDNTDSVYVCPLIETSEIFVSSDSEFADKYSDFIRIDQDDCKNMFNYIPRWIFLLPFVSLVLMLIQCYISVNYMD